MKDRLAASTRMHDLSYRVISHYDSKASPLLTIIGICIAVVGFILTGFFRTLPQLVTSVRVATIVFCAVNFALIITSLVFIRRALMPHVSKATGQPKPKLGLTYFKDVLTHFKTEELFVRTMLGQVSPPTSPYYQDNEADAFTKCLIEDHARDIFAHAEILDVKTAAVTKAFKWVLITVIVLLATTVILGSIYALNVPLPLPSASGLGR